MRISAALAVCVGLGLRLFFVFTLPATNSGDSPFYIELAWNWLKRGVYGFSLDGQLTPVDMRAPGYPAFLAAIFAFAGNSQRAVMLVQVIVDLATCVVIALIAARLAKPESRARVALAALWLAALCPFTANYTAVVLTETFVTFLTALAILVLLETDVLSPPILSVAKNSAMPWLLAGVLAGFGALVRPETPLILAAVGAILICKWWRPRDWQKLARAALLMAVGLALPLMPWAARNWRTLHEVQFLAPRYSQLPGEVVPRGFTAWTNTWLWRMRDVYLVTWNLNSYPISMDDIPSTAFDSQSEKDRIGALLDQHNQTLTETDEMDERFGQIARERTSRHPLRTYLKIPLLRSLALWFTPRTELLPVDGHLSPFAQQWDEDRADLLVTLSLTAISTFYVAIALLGAWKTRYGRGLAFLLTFIVLRTLFFASFVDTPEPRYVLECFPALIAFGALAFQKSAQRSSSGSG
jgi:4-amino-4-deoxy-L-arabinose transferase-like glycosyltransferase